MPRRGTLERVCEHEQRVRGAGIADAALKIIRHRIGADAAGAGELRIELRDRTREDEVIDRGGLDPCIGECRSDRPRHQLADALIAHPALLPRVVDLGVGGTKMVDEVDRQRSAAEILGDDPFRAQEQRGSAVAKLELLCARRARVPEFRGKHQLRSGAGRLGERQRHRRECDALRARDVDGIDGVVEAQRLADDAGIRAFHERHGARGQI